VTDVTDEADGADDWGAFEADIYGASQRSRKPYPRLHRSLLQSIRKTLCGFEWKPPYWVSEPMKPFRPEGLLVGLAPAGARLVEWSIGAELVLPTSRQPLVLSTFTILQDHPRAMPHLPTCGPGLAMRIRVSDARGAELPPELVELTVWGVTVVHY